MSLWSWIKSLFTPECRLRPDQLEHLKEIRIALGKLDCAREDSHDLTFDDVAKAADIFPREPLPAGFAREPWIDKACDSAHLWVSLEKGTGAIRVSVTPASGDPQSTPGEGAK